MKFVLNTSHGKLRELMLEQLLLPMLLVAGVGAVSIGGFGVVVVVIVVDQLMSNLGLRAWLKSDNERSRFL